MIKYVFLFSYVIVSLFGQDSGKVDFSKDLEQIKKLDSSKTSLIMAGDKAVERSELDEMRKNLKDSIEVLSEVDYISDNKPYAVYKIDGNKVYRINPVIDMDQTSKEIIYVYNILVLGYEEPFSGNIQVLDETVSKLIFSVLSTRGYSDKITFSPPMEFMDAKLTYMEYIKKNNVRGVISFLKN